MQLWLDNIAASIVLVVLAMMLLSVESRTQQAALEQSSFYAMRTQQLRFIETLERDLHNAYRLDDLGMAGTDSLFDFRTTLSANHADTVRVRYRLRRTGTSGTVALFQMERYERSAVGVYSLQGASPPFVTAMRLEAQNEQAGAVGNVADAKQVLVSFELLTPWRANLERIATIERVRWETTYRPLVLHDMPRV